VHYVDWVTGPAIQNEHLLAHTRLIDLSTDPVPAANQYKLIFNTAISPYNGVYLTVFAISPDRIIHLVSASDPGSVGYSSSAIFDNNAETAYYGWWTRPTATIIFRSPQIYPINKIFYGMPDLGPSSLTYMAAYVDIYAGIDQIPATVTKRVYIR
jgi:hypothetical protein